MKRTSLLVTSRVVMILLVAVLSATKVCAETKTWTSGDCTATLVDGVLTLSGEGRTADYGIPDVRPWVYDKSAIKKVVIESGVTYVGDNTFCDLPQLKEIDFSKAASLHRLGMYTFAHNTQLTSVELPEKLDTIGQHTFEECTALLYIGIPATVTGIGNHAFKGCSSLPSITIPAAVARILKSTFEDCAQMKTITLAEGTKLEVIDTRAFANSGLTSIDLPASVETISYEAFDNCQSLTAINIAPKKDGYVSIDGVVFFQNNTYLYIYPAGKPDASYEVPSTVEVISPKAFKGCKALTSVTFPDGLQQIGGNDFDGCTGLTSVTLPSSLNAIGEATFANCSNLAAITFNSNPRFDRNTTFDGIKDDAVVQMILPGINTVEEVWQDFHCCLYSFETEADTKIFKGNLTDDGVLLTELTADKIVPSNNGVLFKKTTSGDIVLKLTSATSSNDFSNNCMKGEDFPVSGFGNYYQFDNRAEGLGFFKITPNDRINVGHVYFTIESTSGDPVPTWYPVSEVATGIHPIKGEMDEAGSELFDLQGRQLSASPVRKGIVVSDGRKIVVR